jgi:beta-phosphoglucomutase-like phosphatase (HAD superfamily)
MGMGDPRDFYDAIITAGFPLRGGRPGTLGELAPKPHPWLYAETARVGLGLDPADRHSVVGIEDSAAGVISIRLAGFAAIGIAGGNIEAGGVRGLCSHSGRSLAEVAALIL